MANKFYLGTIFVLLLGCQAGWDKNPRLEGLPPEVEQEAPTFMNAMRDSIFIQNEPRYEFVEGQQDVTVEFDVKVLQEDIEEVRAEIPGLEDYLTGATQSFDPATGKLTIHWDVPDVFVRGIQNNEVSYDLKVSVYTRSKNQTQIGKENLITFKVLRKLERPEIVSVGSEDEKVPEVRENANKSFKVVVRDPNSSNGQLTISPPVLLAEPSGSLGRQSGHHLLRIGTPSQDSNDPQLWTFNVSINTTGLEITDDSALFYYDLRAYSPMAAAREMLRSPVHSGSFKVVTNIGQVAFTGGHRVNFREGASNSVTVAFYDPRGEGKAVVDTDELAKTCGAKGAICECKAPTSNKDIQVCEIWWSPKATDADPRRELVHTFEFKAWLQHKTTKETSKAKDFVQEIHVTAAF